MKLPSVPVRLLVGLVLLLCAALGLQNWRMARMHRAAGAAALEADTLRAARDSSRQLTLQLQDSLERAVGRLAIQRPQVADAVDRQLRQQRLALVQLQATVRSLEAVVRSTEPTREDSSGARVASFHVRQAPYTVDADVTLPRPPGAGQLGVRVAVDSATVAVRLGCLAPNAAGIRSAQATVVGPAWLPIRLGRVEQDAGLCRSPALEPAKGRGAWWRRLEPHLAAGYGLTFSQGQVLYGPQLQASIDLWRP